MIESIEPRRLLSTIYVDANATGATHDGTSWNSAYQDLQLALSAAVSGDEIHVADGTYKPTSGTDRTISFALKSGVSIYGGYAGDGAANPDARNLAANVTILSGDIGTAGNNADNSYHVVAATGIGSATAIDGLTVTLGNANGTTVDRRRGGGLLVTSGSSLTFTDCAIVANKATSGGGMSNDHSSATFINCAFSGNIAADSGGGMSNTDSSPSLTNCAFTGNSAVYAGAGMNNYASSPNLIDCTFRDNTASSNGSPGGGMYNYLSSPNLSNCIFNGNRAYWGGGICDERSSPVARNCSFIANVAHDGGGVAAGEASIFTDCLFRGNTVTGGGGGMTAGNSSIVTNCMFTGNTADNGGGLSTYQTVFLTNCTFRGNTAASGGGMSSNSGSSILTNCIFSGNGASIGGGIYVKALSPVLNNCVFSGNSAYYRGGAMYNVSASAARLAFCTLTWNTSPSGGGIYNESSSSPMLTNCIIWSGASNPILNLSKTAAITYCDVKGGYSGVGNISADPQFVRVPWTGPDGVFGTTDDDPGDLRLQIGSPCLDKGSNSAIPVGLTVDFLGASRLQNSIVDMGACEGAFAAPAPKVIYVDGNSMGANTGTSWSNAYTTLQSAIKAANDGDTIRVADGTYTPSSDNNRTIGFALKDGMRLLGGYAGYGASQPDARDMAAYATILSGDIGLPGNVADNSYHVLTAKGLGAPTAIDGLTVFRGNNTAGDADTSAGAGLYVIDSSSLVLTNCTFDGNEAYQGGGIYSSFSLLSLTNCAFVGNSATNSGGAMHNFNCTLTVNKCSVLRNSASSIGGGMYNESCALILSNSTFSGNTASVQGGGVHNVYTSPILANCIFSGNVAHSGGGIYNSPDHTATHSSIYSNCIFSGNSAQRGGGMYSFDISPILNNCTFIGNEASSGGGIYSEYSWATLANCIVWNNGSSPLANIWSIPTITDSDIQGGWSDTGNINFDPRFVRIPSAGQDSVWGTTDDDYGDLRLQLGSPCIDAGNNAAVPAGVTTDLAGNPRIVDVPGVRDFGERVDMGAYEYLPALTYQADAAKPTLRMSFAVDVDPATLSAGDLVLLNITSGQPLSTSGAAVSYDSNTRVATWQFSGALPDGDYRATLPAGSVSDTSGAPLASDSLCNFFILGGDANRDRLVDIKDLYILASNWQGNGKLFSQGDFNYDGKVDAADLGILSARWQQNLPPPVAPVPASIAKVAKRSPVRMVSVVG